MTSLCSFPSSWPDWANLEVLHRNTSSPRADFQIYGSEKEALARDRRHAREVNLSGQWKFDLTNSPLDAAPGFEQETFDSAKWPEITVPGHWQLQGFGRGPHYTNVQYPFFVDPPYPPYIDNECGSYLRTFDVPKDFADCQIRLRFEGVDSAFHIWVNGQEVGYSQGARNPSEFDITNYVRHGETNKLAVRVYQFCDGSYIEDQDQWWLSGIFRDVFLLAFPREVHFEDFMVTTSLDKAYNNAELKVRAVLSADGIVKSRLLDADLKSVADDVESSSIKGTAEWSLPLQNPRKWTAEDPYLYNLICSIGNAQFVHHRIGFRQVELIDGLIKVNGKRVVFKGANRHEHHPTHGRAVPYDFMKQDLLLMKTHHINAIRTCHQPSDPRLYDLADELGFWVMDEADVECHGFETIADAELDPAEKALPFFDRQRLTRGKAASWTSDNPAWRAAYVDRAQHMVHRDKLHPSVIMWSLGNEAFNGSNHVAMTDWIRSYDATRLIHYEPDLDAEYVDMHSRMYPNTKDIIDFAMDEKRTKPLVLCEYIHAMGTGPGNIKEYVDAFYNHPSLQGGWVWEWANHGLLTKSKDGAEYYGYGGDFGDEPNDGNFVLDGALDSDHTPNSGLLEYKKALEPVQLVSYIREKVTIINRLDFATLDDYECCWSLVTDGGVTEKGSLGVPAGIQPGATADLDLPLAKYDHWRESLIELSFRLKIDTVWAKAGHEVAFFQLPLTPPARLGVHATPSGAVITANQEGSLLTISTHNIQWAISLSKGALTSWKKKGEETLAQPLEPSFFRAPTDNDAPQDGWDWLDKKMQYASIHTRNVKWKQSGDQVVVSLDQRWAPRALSWSLQLTSELTFSSNGTLRYAIKATPTGSNLSKTLPRMGFTLGLPADFQKVSWFGRGPGESYKDMKLSQRVGLHSITQVSDLWTGPEYPQECSNRTDTRCLTLSSPSGATLTAQFFDPAKPGELHLFDFMASHYDVHDIHEAKHPYELEKKRKDHVILRLDADHHGLGTGSCGPKTLDEYALKIEKGNTFEYGMLLH
nr:hypothetical protein B0A51_02605 [Rachicladosporium sp. CCFEE 5018]